MVTNSVVLKIFMVTALHCFGRLAQVRYQAVVTWHGFAIFFEDGSDIRFFPSFKKVSLIKRATEDNRIKKPTYINPFFQMSRTSNVGSTCLRCR